MSSVSAQDLLVLMRDTVRRPISKTGNSHAVILPKPMMEDMALDPDDEVLIMDADTEPAADLEEHLVCRLYRAPEQDDDELAVPDAR